MTTEKLNYEDGYVGELLVSKINELIDRLDAMELRLDTRMDKHWAYHRHKAIEEGKFVPTENKEEKKNGDTESKERKDTKKS